MEGSRKLLINPLELFQLDLYYQILFAMLAAIEKVHRTYITLKMTLLHMC